MINYHLNRPMNPEKVKLRLGHSPVTKILDFEPFGSNCLMKMVIFEENDPTLMASKWHFKNSYGLEIPRHD